MEGPQQEARIERQRNPGYLRHGPLPSKFRLGRDVFPHRDARGSEVERTDRSRRGFARSRETDATSAPFHDRCGRRVAGSFSYDHDIAGRRRGFFQPIESDQTPIHDGGPQDRRRDCAPPERRTSALAAPFLGAYYPGRRDYERHVDYVHFNPVKHHLVASVRDWRYSSFHHYVRNGVLPEDWAGDFGQDRASFGERRD